MNWPVSKILRLPNGGFQCVDCKIEVFDLKMFNGHDCELGMGLLRAKQPNPTPKPVPSEKPKPTLETEWKEWF